MLRSGHLGLAALAWAPIGRVLATAGGSPGLALVGFVASVGLATVPDVDQESRFVEHRGPTHSLAFLAFAATIAAGAGFAVGSVPVVGESLATGTPTPGAFGTPRPPRFAVAAVAGTAGATAVGSHLLGDAVTPAGVPLLWPFTRHRFRLVRIPAESRVANGSALLAGIGAATLVAVEAAGVAA